LIGSKGSEKSINEKGNYGNKLMYFPNWAESVVPVQNTVWYQQLKPFADFSKEDFVVLFAGNIGEAQNIDCIIDVAVELKHNPAVKFVFIGNGRKKETLESRVKNLCLSDSVFFPGQYILDAMPVFMQMADILLVSLKDELIFNLTVPSKVQFYMAQGKPILAMLNGDGAEIINAAQCGKAVPANDSKALQGAVQEFYAMPEQELQILGSNGKQYYERYFRKEQRIEQLDDLFQSFVK
jgi:glycosyltransferase involved in cell wall biosynthesis